jgi:hypothetical protein
MTSSWSSYNPLRRKVAAPTMMTLNLNVAREVSEEAGVVEVVEVVEAVEAVEVVGLVGVVHSAEPAGADQMAGRRPKMSFRKCYIFW